VPSRSLLTSISAHCEETTKKQQLYFKMNACLIGYRFQNESNATVPRLLGLEEIRRSERQGGRRFRDRLRVVLSQVDSTTGHSTNVE